MKTKFLGTFSVILKKVLKKNFFLNGNCVTLESLKYHFKQRKQN